MALIPQKSSASTEIIRTLLDTISKAFAPTEVAVIRGACELAEALYAGQVELSGTPLIQHALGSAVILADMHMDHETIAATILHAAPEYLDDWQEKIAKDFGANVKVLVEGISRMEQIEQFSEMPHQNKKNKDEAAQQIESLRKMLLAMVEDIRVVLIKLAERTQTLRHLSGASAEQQKLIAQQTRSLFAPLANRLGVWQLKWELEDLSVRYLEPELYKQVAKLLDERRADREQYIADVVSQLKQVLSQAGIPAEVTGRPKHIYSIINKMKRKHIDFSELYDVRAVRILIDESKVDGIRGCYTALGLVHELWPPIESEFDDYIAHPKSNNYRSLHTAVMGPRGLALEVQIRTREMHQHSELGVAAHWRYKEGVKSDTRFDEKIAWLRQILEWKEELADKGDLQEQFKNELFH
ncbi:MAG: HD domain-containing protein, partial [Gallionella sp.]